MMRAPKLLIAALSALALLVSGCGFKGLYSANLPGGADVGDHPFTMTVYFANVLDLVPQSAVKVNDVAVGRVDSVELSDAADEGRIGDNRMIGWSARVKITVNDAVKLPTNARAQVKMTSLLGEKYVALLAPTDKPAAEDLRDGSTIPITATSSAPEVEQVLGAMSLLLNGGGLAQLKTITEELNKALDGNEGAIRDLLGQLNTFVGTLDKQKNDITNALDAVDKLAATLAKQKDTIVATLDTFPQALEILKNERTKFVSMLSALSDLGGVATRVINATQDDLVSSLKSLLPVAQQLAASGDDLAQSLKIALTFPFPIGLTRDIIRGDYANLHLYFDLDLSKQLCAFNKLLCAVNPASAGQQQLAPSAAGAQRLGGGLVGVGG
jgi:phospholipid/cholesterol/gamma-HCH transport system substrate-binding protein